MNKLMENFTQRLIDLANSGIDLLTTEIPLFVKELLLWKGATYAVTILLSITAMVIARRFWNKAKAIVKSNKEFNAQQLKEKKERENKDIDLEKKFSDDGLNTYSYTSEDGKTITNYIRYSPLSYSYDKKSEDIWSTYESMGIFGLIFIIPAIVYLYKLLKIAIAPRIWLLEYAAELIKTTQ